ncbi:MAG: hypothetical protein ACREXY_10200, partial [Gammaproteobacteria bacterium]
MILSDEVSAVATFGLLSLSVVALWVRIPGRLFASIGSWTVPFLLSLGFALDGGLVSPRGLIFIVLFGLVCWLHVQ